MYEPSKRVLSPQRRARSTSRINNTEINESPNKTKNPHHSAKGIIGNPELHLTKLLATNSYITEVKATFLKKPELYRRFAFLLSNLNEPSNDATAIIQQIVNLFDGHPHLILGLNVFLPLDCELRIQPDAVVIKVHDGETSTEKVLKRATNKAGQAIDYINDVKLTLGEDSRKYRKFLQVLQEYHCNERGNRTTIRKVVKALQEHPALVKGFNAFLPDGFSINVEMEDQMCKIINKNGEISTIHLSQPKKTIKVGRDKK